MEEEETSKNRRKLKADEEEGKSPSNTPASSASKIPSTEAG